MPARSLPPLNYTTPPFAAVSGVVENESELTMPPPAETPAPDLAKPVLIGPFWAMFAVILVAAVIVGLSVAWWKRHQRRLARGYYNELRPVSNYQEWRERQATKLLGNSSPEQSTRTSRSPSRAGSSSGSPPSASLRMDEPSSSSPGSHKD